MRFYTIFTGMPKPYTTVNVDAKVHKRLKSYCKKQGKTMSHQLTEAINKHLDAVDTK